MAYVSKKQVPIIIFSDEICGDFKKRDLFMLCNEMHQHLEDLQNSSESVFSKWPMHDLKYHTWVKYLFKMKDKSEGLKQQNKRSSTWFQIPHCN